MFLGSFGQKKFHFFTSPGTDEIHNGDVRFGEKSLSSPIIFLFMKSKGAKFARVHIIVSGDWCGTRILFQEGLSLLENDKN